MTYEEGVSHVTWMTLRRRGVLARDTPNLGACLRQVVSRAAAQINQRNKNQSPAVSTGSSSSTTTCASAGSDDQLLARRPVCVSRALEQHRVRGHRHTYSGPS